MKSKLFLAQNILFIIFRNDGYAKFLTKGDTNQIDDRGLYSPKQLWLEKKDIIGKVKGYANNCLSFCTRIYFRYRYLDIFHT